MDIFQMTVCVLFYGCEAKPIGLYIIDYFSSPATKLEYINIYDIYIYIYIYPTITK